MTKHEEAMIHEVMKMAYEQGVEEGRKQALKAIKERAELPYDAFGDYSHHPEENVYTKSEGFTADKWYRENFRYGND